MCRVFLCIFFIFYCISGNALTMIPPVIVKKPIPESLSQAHKTVITQEQIAMTGATSLSQALQELGGVQLVDTSGNGSQVLLSMRGFGANASSNTLLLINGVPITNPDMAPPDLNVIPLPEIEYIEIIAGSESVLYGDQAVGGIINIVTRKPHEKNLNVACAAGSYSAKNCYAAFSNLYRQLQYGINGWKNTTANYREHNDYNQEAVSGFFNYPYSTGSLEFDYKIAKEKMLYPGALTAEQVEEDRRQANNDTDFFSDDSDFFHAQQKQKLNANWLLTTDVARRDMHGHGVLSSPFTQSRTTNYIAPQIKGTLGNSLLTGGIDLESDRYNLDTDFGITDDSLQKYGIFGLLNVPLNTRYTLSLGARGAEQKNQLQTTTDNTSLNRALATTLGLSYEISPKSKLFVRRAGSFRFPKADEDASASPVTNGLKTQQGVAYEAGAEWEWRVFNSKFTLYQLNLVDEIAFDPLQTPEDPFGTNRNLDPTQRQGFSFSEKYAMTEQLSFDGQYNYVNARFQSGVNTGNRIPLVAENILRAGIDYAFLTHWNIYTEALYTGSQYPANDDANVGQKMGGFTIYNLNVRYSYHEWSASFRVNNIFNKEYYLYTVFQPTAPYDFFYPAPGTNVLFTLKYSL